MTKTSAALRELLSSSCGGLGKFPQDSNFACFESLLKKTLLDRLWPNLIFQLFWEDHDVLTPIQPNPPSMHFFVSLLNNFVELVWPNLVFYISFFIVLRRWWLHTSATTAHKCNVLQCTVGSCMMVAVETVLLDVPPLRRKLHFYSICKDSFCYWSVGPGWCITLCVSITDKLKGYITWLLNYVSLKFNFKIWDCQTFVIKN